MIRYVKQLCKVIHILSVISRYKILNRYLIFKIIFIVVPTAKEVRKKSLPERLNLALQKLGPVFIKFGQSLSMREDIIGSDFTKELSKLCDKTKPFPFEKAEKIIKKEMKSEICNIFTEFDKKPVASASIAQVYKAKLSSGEAVAVKVLRPNIHKIFMNEIDLFITVARLVESIFPKTKRLKLIETVDKFKKNTNLELDLRIEAANASELKENLADDTNICIPKIFWAHTHQRILTMEWMEGKPIDSETNEDSCKKIAVNLVNTFFNQAYKTGFFHGDLHSGNIMLGENNKIILLDFGIMGRLDLKTRVYVAEILRGFLKKDYNRVAEIHFEAGYVDRKHTEFVSACRALGEPIVGKPISEISIARLLSQLFKITADFNMPTQIQLLLLQKSTVLMEGLCCKIYKKANLWQYAQPWIENWAKQNFGIKAKLFNHARKSKQAMFAIPTIIIETEKLIETANKKLEKFNLNNKSAHHSLLLQIAILATLILIAMKMYTL